MLSPTSSYMMYQKALLFGDPETGAKILAAASPRKVKALGRAVSNFDEAVWVASRYRVVVDGNVAKFTLAVSEAECRRGSGHEDSGNDSHGELLGDTSLKDLLLATGERELVEASPFDKIWGVGFAPERAAEKRASWGLNLLGKALMEVREMLREGKDGKEAKGEEDVEQKA